MFHFKTVSNFLDAPRLLKIAKELDLNVIGVSFHVGCGCKEPEVYGRAIKFARDIFNFALKIGYAFKFLDIGKFIFFLYAYKLYLSLEHQSNF